MTTQLRFLRGILYNYNQSPGNQNSGVLEFWKPLYEFWGYCVNGTSALQTPGGMANTASTTYSVSAASNASPISIVTTSTNALFTGQWVNITGVAGNTAANGIWSITVVSNTNFTLNGSTGNGAYTGGGTISTTAFSGPTNLWEGTPVLAVGNDGYTAAQVSTTLTGDAFFTTTTNNPFTLTSTSFTVSTANNNTTTIAAPSGGQSLPQSIINVATTTPFSTTIAAASNNVSLPTGTINVLSTTGFPSGGTIFVNTTEGTQYVTYTGITATSFTGCVGGIGSMITGASVFLTFAPSGTINVTTNAGVQLVTYTGITATTFTGCSGGTGLMTNGNAVSNTIQLTTTAANAYNNLQSVNVSGILGNTAANGPYGAGSTWIITTPSYPVANLFNFSTTIGFPSNGAALPQGTINSNTAAPFTTTTAVQTLPTGTINVSATATAATTIAAGSNNVSLPTGTINVASNVGFPTSGTLNVFTTANTTIALGSSGATLPQGTIFVASTAGFPTSGSLQVTSSGGPQTVTYNGITNASFLNCSGGTGTLTFGNAVTSTAPVTQTVTYTGLSGTTQFTGCLGGFGTMNTGNTVNNTGFFTNFPTAGQFFVNTTNGAQLITYTNVTATSFTGCTGGSGNTSNGGSVFTSFSPASNYTSIAAGSNGQTLPQTTINVAATAGFPSSGYIYVTTSTGFQVVNYTGTSGGNQFTGCSGGTGTMTTGAAVNLAFAPTGTVNVTSSVGTNIVSYTGTTATTFTGASGGSGTMSTGAAIASPTQLTTTLPTTLVNNQTIAIAGTSGVLGANSTWALTVIGNAAFSLNTSIFNGAFTGGGTITDHSNILLNTSVPNGSWASGGTQTVATTNMVGKALIIWKPNSGTSEDSLYTITSVISPNTVKINLNTGGTPDPVTLHPSFLQRSNINYRVVDLGVAYVANGVGTANSSNFAIFQFNPSAVGINPGQANSQFLLTASNSGPYSGGFVQLSPGGNWNGVAFPVTGNAQLDASSIFSTFSGNIYNGGPATTQALVIAADPSFFLMHFKDLNSGDGSSYIQIDIPTRLYPQATDTNPMSILFRGGVFNGSVFNNTNSSGQCLSRGYAMKCNDGVMRVHYSLAKSLSGDGSPVFGTNVTDVRIAFNTAKGTVLASDCVLTLPGVANQFSLGRGRLRSIKFTSTPLPNYHRFGLAGGAQYLNVQNGCAIIWDNTILPTNLFFIV